MLNRVFSLLLVTAMLSACQTTEVKPNAGQSYTQAEIDLMLQQARMAERQRIFKELETQENKHKVFDEILIQQNQAPRFSDYYRQGLINQEAGKIQPPGSKPAESDKQADEETPQELKLCAVSGFQSLPVFADINQFMVQKVVTVSLCEHSLNAKLVESIQLALFELGYFYAENLSMKEVLNGQWSRVVEGALNQFQKDQGIAFGAITIESLIRLGVITTEDALGKKEFFEIELQKVQESF